MRWNSEASSIVDSEARHLSQISLVLCSNPCRVHLFWSKVYFLMSGGQLFAEVTAILEETFSKHDEIESERVYKVIEKMLRCKCFLGLPADLCSLSRDWLLWNTYAFSHCTQGKSPNKEKSKSNELIALQKTVRVTFPSLLKTILLRDWITSQLNVRPFSIKTWKSSKFHKVQERDKPAHGF